MSFGNKMLPFLGRPNISLDQKFLLDKAYAGYLPGATLVYFQFVFAAITLILVAGALLGRMNFHLWMLFVPLWLPFSYTFTAYSLWAGAGLLWMGWSGFNGGGPFAASTDASLAILNTHVCTATSLLTWLLLDIVFFGKPSVIGATQDMITGLVCITPAAGFFANLKHNRIFYMVKDWQHYIGLAYGLQNGRTAAGPKQMGVQLLGILLTDEELQTGDDALHGEEAYALWGDGEKYESKHNSLHGVEEFPQAVSKEAEMAR
ncbi:ammonium transporter 3 member 1 [Populus alba x Populus x berolinensis]|nr:ammonium transporter 3 member 1 [Populus alba x Populus x berolinensis]